jgi:catechol 2,3-dioxygenase-like lactoylglutathione lyase family enzyme
MFYTPDRMRLGAVIVYVEDVGRTVEFWERAFGLERGPVQGDDYSELRAGSESLLAFVTRRLIEEQIPGHGRAPQGFEVALVADDVQAAFDHAVAAGAEAVKAPHEQPWGQAVSYVRAPEGTLVEICSAW